jgi:hypothetical protein
MIAATPYCAIQSHNGGYSAVNPLCALFLVYLDISGGVGADENVIHHPAKHRLPAVGKVLLQCQLIKSLSVVTCP